MSDRMPEDMPDRMPEDLPDRMPEDMSDRMPEDLPVRKCINVMVGISRSKVSQNNSQTIKLTVKYPNFYEVQFEIPIFPMEFPDFFQTFH
jgi:hypothetical protein